MNINNASLEAGKALKLGLIIMKHGGPVYPISFGKTYNDKIKGATWEFRSSKLLSLTIKANEWFFALDKSEKKLVRDLFSAESNRIDKYERI